MIETEVVPHDMHISDMLSDLYDALEERRGWSLVRLGDGEVRVLRGDRAPMRHQENFVDNQDSMELLRIASEIAVRDADWVGWHQDPYLTEQMNRLELLPALYDRSQYAWCNLHMGIRRGFVERVLRNSKLFLVGEPMQRWLNEYLHPRGLGLQAEIYQGKQSPTCWGDILNIREAMAESEAQVVLASLGIWALPISRFAKQYGRIGIDIGCWPDHCNRQIQKENIHGV